MLAVAVSALSVHGRSKDRGYVVPQASDLAVAGDARWGSRPMAEHRVMSEDLLDLTHYRSGRWNESQEKAPGSQPARAAASPERMDCCARPSLRTDPELDPRGRPEGAPDRREDGTHAERAQAGIYSAPAMKIGLGEAAVRVVPMGSDIHDSYQNEDGTEGRYEGRVDILLLMTCASTSSTGSPMRDRKPGSLSDGPANRNGSTGHNLKRSSRICCHDRDAGRRLGVRPVRKFRNWVAHGRRGDAENEVTPEQSRERLKKFLELLASWEPETPDTT